MRSNRHRSERGQVFAMVAILVAVFGGMAALSIDVGSMMIDRRDLQNSADAIALAASQELPNQDAATTAANQWAANNGIAQSSMTLTFVSQNVPSVPNPKVTVTLTKDHQFTFARLVGITHANVQATAGAIRTSSGGSNGLMPWSVKKSVKDAAVPGQALTMKYDANNPSNGNFGAMRLDGNGSNIYRDTIENGSTTGYCASGVSGCAYPSTVDSQTGNMVGPTRTGADYRIANTSSACSTWDEAVQVNPDGTMGLKTDCNPFVSGGNANSLRIIVIPIVASLCNGSCTVTIKEFALFFLESYGAGGCTGNECEIKGRFITSNTNYGSLTGVFDANSFAHFVRLVQ